MAEQELMLDKKLESFQKDSGWFYENYSYLRDKSLTGKFVAVKNKIVIAYSENLDVLIKLVEQQGENPSYVLIEFVYPEETVVLL
ncbi:hypothetical protein J4462_00680 [Candidatus Pacearchaeota archaeon]|nr:hypothetical protein [Candidatus Pacearchaeota archaeon]